MPATPKTHFERETRCRLRFKFYKLSLASRNPQTRQSVTEIQILSAYDVYNLKAGLYTALDYLAPDLGLCALTGLDLVILKALGQGPSHYIPGCRW